MNYTTQYPAQYRYPVSYAAEPVPDPGERARRMKALKERSRQRRRKRMVQSVFRLCLFSAVLCALYLAFPWIAQKAQVWKEANSTGPYPLFRNEQAEAVNPVLPAETEEPAEPEALLPPAGEMAEPLDEPQTFPAADEAEAEIVVWPPRYALDTDTAVSGDRFRIRETADTFHLSMVPEESAIKSLYVVLLDAETGEILAERTPDAMINPASMTKVLTLLTAVEALESGDAHPDGVTGWGSGMDGTAVIDQPIRDYCWSNGCSVAGFERYERLPVRDLLYGCILPSGADACLALANFVDGSHGAFVERMNRKLEEMGLAEQAHFTNCVGLYDPEHHCTVKAMAAMMKAAMDNETCREVLGRRYYTTAATEQHPQGILLTNLFIRRIEDSFLESPLKVIGAKTGYVNQSGNCAVSFARREDGREYIVVTGMGWGAWNVIRDHTALYQAFCGG